MMAVSFETGSLLSLPGSSEALVHIFAHFPSTMYLSLSLSLPPATQQPALQYSPFFKYINGCNAYSTSGMRIIK